MPFRHFNAKNQIMTQVLHLIDDAGIGGVTRVLADYLPNLGDGFTHDVLRVATNRLLPDLPNAEIVVVHFTPNWSKLPFLLALRLRTQGRILVLVEHSYTQAYERLRVPHRARFRTMLRLAYRLADRVVAVSKGQAAWLRDAQLVPPERLAVIPNACNPAPFVNVPDLARRTGPLRLGAYGRYAPQKGFDLLVAAMHSVPASVATLVLAGYGPNEVALRAAAAGLDHVSIAGPTDAPADFLAGIDAVVVPSRWEAFGLVAAEARAAGRPILVASVDGLIEQVDSAWGMLFKPSEPGSIAAAIHGLAGHDLVAMGAAARGSVRGAMDATIGGWLALLRDVATRSARAQARIATVSHALPAQPAPIG